MVSECLQYSEGAKVEVIQLLAPLNLSVLS